jgi:hypothetical protein
VNPPAAGLQAIQDITAEPITPQTPFGGGEDQFGSPGEIEQAPDDDVLVPMKTSVFDASDEELTNAIARRNRQVQDAALATKNFASDPNAEGSLAFTRTGAGQKILSTGRAEGALPSRLALSASRDGVNPFDFNGNRKADAELAEEWSSELQSRAAQKVLQFNERMGLARDLSKERIDSAEARATRRERIRVMLSAPRQGTLDDQAYVVRKRRELADLREMAPRIQQMFLGPGQQVLGGFGTLEITKMMAQLSDAEQVQFARDFISRVETFSADIRHELYGAALTATELPRVLSSLPSPENSLATILTQLQIQEDAFDDVDTHLTKRLNEIDSLVPDSQVRNIGPVDGESGFEDEMTPEERQDMQENIQRLLRD